MTRRLAAYVLLMLLVGSVFDRCLVTCLSASASADVPAVPACHHDETAAAQPTSDGAFVLACAHEHASDATPAELSGTGRWQSGTQVVLVEVPQFSLDPFATSPDRSPALDGPPLLVLDSGSDRRQLRL